MSPRFAGNFTEWNELFLCSYISLFLSRWNELVSYRYTVPIAFRSDVNEHLSSPFRNAIFRGIIAATESADVVFRSASESCTFRIG
jgi:hypothetical protein